MASIFPRYSDWSVARSDRSSTSYSTSSSSVRDMEVGVGSVIPNCYSPSTNCAVIVDMNDERSCMWV
jgi:hypothetical protein